MKDIYKIVCFFLAPGPFPRAQHIWDFNEFHHHFAIGAMDGGEAEAVVTVKRVCMVEPAVPTLRQSMFLSSLDLLFLPFHNIQRLLFYRLTHANDYSSVIENLKNGLSLVLVHFYPLAGQMKISESGRPEVECNNRGVEFKEVSINVPFHDLEKDGFQRKPFFKNLVHEADNSADENYGRPLLSIQVTAFEGGGISIGTTIHHVMVDGNSYWHFMTSWAECSRGISIAKPPQHDRALLKQGNQSPMSISFKAHEIVSHGITGAKIFKFVTEDSQLDSMETSGSWNVEKTKESLQKWGDPKRTTEVISSTLCFTEDIIQELKNRSGVSSSFVAVAAQFWRCVIRAREVPLEEAVYFLVLANCRDRVKPPLLPTYFGNCISMGVAQTTANKLVHADISFAADVLQQLINSCTQEAQINHLIDWAEFPNRNFVSLLEEAGWKYGTNVASSPRFPLYEMDYGWGKPVDVQMANIYEIGSMHLSCPKDGGKSILVSTCLPQHQMDLLQKLLFV